MKPTSLIVKLASIIVHYEEAMSNTGRHYDKEAAESQMKDIEVKECFEILSKNALLPLKRD